MAVAPVATLRCPRRPQCGHAYLPLVREREAARRLRIIRWRRHDAQYAVATLW